MTGPAPAEGARERPVVPTAVLGMAIFLGAEVMFFAGLVSAFLVLKAGRPWPPLGQPSLPVVLTAINTAFLFASAALVQLSVARTRGRGGRSAFGPLAGASALGLLFLVIQGFEWIRLAGFGLTMTSSVYGGTFYTLIGAHALHVLGGLVGLLLTASHARAGRYTAEHSTGLSLCRMYWFFVTGIWPVLYGLVYL